MQPATPPPRPIAGHFSNRSAVIVPGILGIGFVIAAVALLVSRPFTTGSPGDLTFPLVLGVLFVAAVFCFVAAFRFPIRFQLDTHELRIHYLHRVETVPIATIRTLQVRGGFVQRNVWLVLRDGTERPLGTRNRRIAVAWNESRGGPDTLG